MVKEQILLTKSWRALEYCFLWSFVTYGYCQLQKNYGFKISTNNNVNNNVNNNYNHSQLFVKHGKWMPGKRHNQTCDFIPEITCCKNTQNLHFEFRNRKLNKIDAVEELRKYLKNKKMLLIGDSLMLEFYLGLAEFTGCEDIIGTYSTYGKQIVFTQAW